jgi:glycine oxidase
MAEGGVVIIGAGAVGCATAYYLAHEGVRSVVVEKDAIADHASGFAFGGLTSFAAAAEGGVEYALAREAFRLHRDLAVELREQTGIDSEFSDLPYYALATEPEEKRAYTANFEWLRSQGYAAEWIEADELRRREPRLAEQVIGASVIDGAGLLEAYRYTLSLAQAAEKLGAEIRHGEVVRLQRSGDRVTAVETRGSTIPCDRLVVAAGPWSGQASDWLGCRVPIYPLKGQIVRLRLQGQPLNGRFTYRGQYFASKSDGMIWCGTTEEKVGFDERITDQARDEILLSLAGVFPPIMDAEIVKQTACLRPYSDDGLPIIGPLPGLANAWIATGGGRRGILFSAVMGRAIADLLTGKQPAVDLTPFGLQRFGS